MPVTVNGMMGNLDVVYDVLLEEHKRQCLIIAGKVEQESKDLLKQTLRHRDGSSAFKGARVVATSKVETKARGCTINVHLFVSEASSRQPHKIWHYVNRGRGSFRAKDTIRFKSRKARTKPRDFNPRPKNPEGEWVTIPKGKRFGKTKGRAWYAETAKRVKKRVLDKAVSNLVSFNKTEVDNG